MADAVEAACATGIERVRLGSLEPETVTEALLQRLKSIAQFCPHFHLSLQSGSAGTLKRMSRRYSPAQYMEKLALICRYFPEAGVTTDVIVGFPGESEEEFAESSAFVAAAGFLKVHVFPYSRRPGTPAADMPGQVPRAVKAARAAAMQAASAPSARAFLEGMRGRTVPVLFESPLDGKPGWMRGYAPNYADVAAPVGPEAKGSILHIRLHGVEEETLLGDATGPKPAAD
jgi:threonylcarbamoyladenosine tRNA methylthiotransferase MtaB